MIRAAILLAVVTSLWPLRADGSPSPDPTRPTDYFARTIIEGDLPQQVSNWKVTAIQISDRGRTAIVNGRILRAGDEIGNVTVLEITPKSVVLDYDRRQLVVSLIPYTVKKKLAERRKGGNKHEQ